jgi:uncharacterized protein YbcI
MPGFQFRYRRDGGEPTVRRFLLGPSERLTRGDMVRLDDDAVALGEAGDTRLVGAAADVSADPAGTTFIDVSTDEDAIYAVDDPRPRARGDRLVLTGATGEQGVASSPRSELVVEADCTADEPTLVSIEPSVHHRLEAHEAAGRATGGALNAALARAVVRYYRAQTGRGPTRAQAFYRGDVIVVVLEDTLTKAERSLVHHGRADAVLQLRDALHEIMRTDMVATVEQLTGATVRAFISGNEVDPDIAVETFILDRPVRDDPPDPPI